MTKRYYIGSVCGDAPLLDMQGDCLISDVNDRNALKKEFPYVLERLNEQDERIQELENKCEDFEQDNMYLEDRVNTQYWKLKQRDKRIQELEERIQEEQELNTDLCNFNLHDILDKKNKEINQLNADYDILKEELRATRKNRDKLIKKYNNKIKKLKRDKHIIFSTINRFVNKYEEKAEVIRFKKHNTPDDYINQGRLRMLSDLMNVLESHEVQEG